MNRFQNLAFLAAMTGVAMISVGIAAEAAVIGTATLVKDPGNGIPFAAPDAALPAPWVSYKLGLQSTAGEHIAGLIVSISGPLHQRWIFNEDFAEFNSTPNSSNQSNGDSHLMATGGALLDCLGGCPLEDNSGVGSPLPDTSSYNYGVGTMLEGFWGISNATTSANVAYIVIPKGTEPLLDIRVRVANPVGDIIADLGERDFFPIVPEPASGALCSLALAGFACMMRRRSGSCGSARSVFPRRIARFTAVTLGLVIASNTVAEAAVFGTITLMRDPSIGVPFLSPDAALPTPWVSYALGLQSTQSETLAAVDFTLHGQLHQRWVDTEDGGIFQPTANSSSNGNGDSHLRAAPGALFGSGPSEDNSGAGSPLADSAFNDYGVGSMLRGAWGIPFAGQSTSASLAYIVIPKGTESQLEISVKVGTQEGSIVATLDRFDFIENRASARVTGNGLMINDGDNMPRLEDDTDFGLVSVGSAELRTFMVSNIGTAPVVLGPPTLTGPFSLVGAFPSSVNPTTSAMFTVRMDTSAPGAFAGSITFGSNAFLTGPFNFSLAGQVVPEPTGGSLCSLAFAGLIGIVRRRPPIAP